jgi:hypothetical protein
MRRLQLPLSVCLLSALAGCHVASYLATSPSHPLNAPQPLSAPADCHVASGCTPPFILMPQCLSTCRLVVALLCSLSSWHIAASRSRCTASTYHSHFPLVSQTDSADIPPPNLGACCYISKGMMIVLNTVIALRSLSLLSLSPQCNCPAVIFIVVFVSRDYGCPCIVSCWLR